jgi:acetyl esterase/lipase
MKVTGTEKIDPLSVIDAQLAELANSVPRLELTDQLVPIVRNMLDGLEQPLPAPAPQPVERLVEIGTNGAQVRVLLFDPIPEQENKPTVIFFHGGGMVAGRADNFPQIPQLIASDSQCLVISVDYPLAPEMPFPGALEDNLALLEWLEENANELGIDANKIALAGQSAGGGHAASLAIAARDRGLALISYLLLIEPMLDDRTGSERHLPAHLGYFGWSAESNAYGWSALLGTAAGSSSVPEAAVPARTSNLSGLPPTCILVGAADLFAEECLEFSRRLILAGVRAELYMAPGAFHGSSVLAPTADISIWTRKVWQDAIRRWLK